MLLRTVAINNSAVFSKRCYSKFMLASAKKNDHDHDRDYRLNFPSSFLQRSVNADGATKAVPVEKWSGRRKKLESVTQIVGRMDRITCQKRNDLLFY